MTEADFLGLGHGGAEAPTSGGVATSKEGGGRKVLKPTYHLIPDRSYRARRKEKSTARITQQTRLAGKTRRQRRSNLVAWSLFPARARLLA